MKPGFVLLVMGIAMFLMTAVFTSGISVLYTLCHLVWDTLYNPKFWGMVGFLWGIVLVLLGIIHIVGAICEEDKS